MKTIYRYLSIGVIASMVVSCADLDTEFYGRYVTDQQKEDVLKAEPDMALASVTAVASQFGSYYGKYASQHYDFGYPSLMMGLDSQTADLLAKIPYSSTHIYWYAYIRPNDSGIPTNMMWTEIYQQINTANSVLAKITAEAANSNKELMFYRAQALAVRAFDYWVLAQCYQFNYYGNENEPCVPIITEKNMEAVATEGIARATVQQVYDQILADLDEAITLIAESGYDPSKVISDRPKRFVSLAAAYGQRARVYLTMHKYDKAAEDAQTAIDNFKQGRPYTREEVSVPSFTTSESPSWMWAIVVASNDRPTTTGICNWPSQFGSFNSGYASESGGWRWCNKQLYESIPETDVRKGWWINENFESPNLSPAMQEFISSKVGPQSNDYTAMSNDIMPYTQVKFGLYGGDLGDYTTGYDVPLMRIEEMYLIVAEGEGMSGNVANGCQDLTQFVKQYRDPDYSFTTADPTEFQDEVWRQRRIEFWGEGLAYFDVQRLFKTIDRTNGACMDDYNYVIKADDPVRIYCLPLDEINSNPQISSTDNNESAPRPTAVVQ